jgi:hypothetical protein
MRAYRFTQAIVAVLAVAGLVGLIVWYGYSLVRASAPASVPVAHPAMQGKTCEDCHAKQSPHGPLSAYQGPCNLCHVITGWTNVSYTHAEKTMNEGLHPVIGCSRCHDREGNLPRSGCETCHESPHVPPSFGCGYCHAPVGWAAILPPPLGHLSLAGGHSTVSCLKCHNNPDRLPPPGCVSCHGPQHGGLTDCESCHDVAFYWKPVKFSHDRVFPLVGNHRFVSCTRCHPGLLFGQTQGYCNYCHAVVHPDLTDCASCHTPYGWLPSTFVHSRVWTLTGEHRKLPCTRCHPNNDFAHPIGGGSTQCVSCHGVQHGGLTDCASCHNTSAWAPSTFKHSRWWTLTGAHANLKCSSCHPGGMLFAWVQANGYPKVKTSSLPVGNPPCRICHGEPHGSCLPTCTSCHDTSSFSDAHFAHSSIWALTGKHVGLACSKCHPSGIEFCVVEANGHSAVPASANVGGVIQCSYCHTSPHGSIPSPYQCTTCHNTSGWANLNSGFTHPSSFPLNGAHQGLACSKCHGDPPQFNLTSGACVTCHGVPGSPQVPPSGHVPHVGPDNCAQCHNAVAWNIINFTHVPMTFHPAYTGINQDCSNCHTPTATSFDFTAYHCTPCHTDGRTYPPPGY